jgi:transcriptional regulator with XRE-family HTH domain
MATRWEMMRGPRGLSATEFAAEVGLDERSVRRYLEGDRLPSPDVLRAWERVCGLPMGALDRYVRPDSLLHGDIDVPMSDPSRRFVGRDAEVRELSRALARAASGCQMVLIGGEPGVGKSRLAAELAVEASGRGAAVVGGSCDEMLRRPFQPFDRVLMPITGPLTELLPAHDRVELGVDRLRSQLFEAATTALARLASDVGLVVAVLDDLHWAAEPALLLLRHLVFYAPRLPLLLVATYNYTELDRNHPLSYQLEHLRHAERTIRLSLRGVSEDDIVALLPASGTTDQETRQLARAIHRETNGNPLFVWEMIDLLNDSDVNDDASPAQPSQREFSMMALPEGIRDAIGRRLRRRSGDVITVLSIAAVIGSTFELTTLRKIDELGLDSDDVLEALDEACRAHLIDELALGRYRFAHGLIRRTLQEELSTTRRASLHQSIARALAAAGASAGDVAHHWYEGASSTDAGEAARWSLAAADVARSQSAWEEALLHARRGLELLDRGEDDVQLRARLLILIAETPQRGWEESRHWARLAADAARVARDPVLLARSAVAFASSFDVAIGDDEAIERCRSALEALSASEQLDESTRAARSLLLSILTVRLVWSGRGGPATRAEIDQLRAEAMAEARRSANPRALDQAYEANLIALEGHPDISLRLALADERAAISGVRADPRLRATARLCTGDVAGFDADAAAFEADPDPWRVATAAHLRAMRALLDGRFDEVERDAEIAVTAFEANINFRTVYLTQIFWLHYETGRLTEIESVVEDAVASLVHLRGVAAAAALGMCELGHLDKARDLLDQVLVEGLDTHPRDFTWPFFLALVIEVAFELRDPAPVAEAAQELRPFAGQLIVVGPGTHVHGAVDRFLGIASAMAGDISGAERHFAAGLVLEAAATSPPLQARTRYWWARALTELADTSMQARAKALATMAHDDASVLGMASLAERARAFVDERRMNNSAETDRNP